MARCLQTLVLAREQIVAPVFSSIEEYLGRNTQAYYDVLADVGQGSWRPGNSALPWIRFCMTAHSTNFVICALRFAQDGRPVMNSTPSRSPSRGCS